MAKEITVNDVLTKISSILKTDMYLIDYCHCIGGKESEEKTVGENILLLSPKAIDLFKKQFPESPSIFFSDIKKAKTDIATILEGNKLEEEEYWKVDIPENEKKEYVKRRDFLIDIIKKQDIWDNFSFTEEELNILYKKCGTIELFENDKNRNTVIISKSIFPMVSEKEVNNVCYTVFDDKDDEDMGNLLLCYDSEYFQIYSLIRFVKIK